MTESIVVMTSEDGNEITFTPDHASPLGVEPLRALAKGSTGIDMLFQSNHASTNGEAVEGIARIRAKIAFHHHMVIFTLVPGGWLPMPFAFPRQYLVDRNVVISMEKIRSGRNASNSEAIKWWLNLISDDSSLFNPLPYAYEAGKRRKPSYSEFKEEYDRGAWEIRHALPNCRVSEFQELHYRVAYDQLEAFDDRREAETRFLERVCPQISQRVGLNREEDVLLVVLAAAINCGVNKRSLVVLAALSCLYEDIHGQISIGRAVLKPTQIYSREAAYNALSDIGHIELAMAGHTYFPGNAFHLCTSDTGIAMLWSALAACGIPQATGEIELSLTLSEELFQRLDHSQILELTTKLLD